MKTVYSILLGLLVLPLAACGDGGGSGQPAAGEVQAAVAGHTDEGHAADSGYLKLTSEQIHNADIRVATAGPANIRERLPLYGLVTPNAERVREVTARFPGVIRSVARRVGDSVAQGEILATVESNESLQTYSVTSPLKGVVTARNANPGEHAGDKALFTVADLSTVWVELSLFPRDVSKVRLGQVVRVKSSDSRLTGDGKVVYVAPFGSTSNQTVTARVLLENADRKWPPGLYVTAEVTLGSDAVPLTIANEALQTLDRRNVVFVQSDEGFEPRSIDLGKSDDELTEVTAGLKPGETYVTKNSFILKAELGKGEAAHED